MGEKAGGAFGGGCSRGKSQGSGAQRLRWSSRSYGMEESQTGKGYSWARSSRSSEGHRGRWRAGTEINKKGVGEGRGRTTRRARVAGESATEFSPT